MRHGHPTALKRKKVFFGVVSLLIIVVGLVAGVLGIETVREFFSRASYERANLVIDAAAVVGPLERPWRNLGQGGEDKEWRMTALTGSVRALNPEYIRIDHVYDFYDIVSGSPGNLSFNFSKIDPLLDDIAAAGARPYIALSYMPSGLSADGQTAGPPVRYEDWQLMVRKLIEHVSGTRGTTDVYYEVWNEPDLFGGWKYYGDRNYLTLYGYASAGARQAQGVRPFKLGGPATTALYKNWFDALAVAAIENNWKFDFFSWHRYSRDIEVYRSDIALVNQWIQAYPALQNKVEFHITEWGHDSEVDPGYDGVYAAAHSVAGAIEMVGVVDRAFVFEIQDGKDPAGKEYWGRWGMFTHSSFGSKAKPRYRALQFLDSVGPEQLRLLGKGTFVKALATTDKQSGKTQIIISNFDPAGRNTEVVPITVKNMPEGDYTIDIAFVARAKEQQIQTTAGTLLQFALQLKPQDVALVTITKR